MRMKYTDASVTDGVAPRYDARDFEAKTYAKVGRRLIPFLMLCYLGAYLDRVNVGFAKLQMLNELGSDRCPELRVLCLFVLRDPYWVGLAQEIAEAPPRPHVGTAMRQLLTSPPTGRRG